jgi:hypothetical protein
MRTSPREKIGFLDENSRNSSKNNDMRTSREKMGFIDENSRNSSENHDMKTSPRTRDAAGGLERPQHALEVLEGHCILPHLEQHARVHLLRGIIGI